MSIKIKLVLLAVIYIFLMQAVYKDAAEYYLWIGTLAPGEALPVSYFLHASLFNMQKIFYVQTGFFTLLLFFTHKPMLAPEYFMRCKPHYYRKLLLSGAVRVGGYSVFAISVCTIIPILHGSPFEIDMWSILWGIRFFLIIAAMYLLYLAIYLMIKRVVFSAAGIAIINIVISSATLATWNDALQDTVLNCYLLLGIGLVFQMQKFGGFMIQLVSASKFIKKKEVLCDVSMTFEKGKLYLLRGHNGSGKTMLLRLICGLIKPDSGTITGNQGSFGVMIETPTFVLHETARENLRFLEQIQKKIGMPEIEAALAKVGLSDDADNKVKTYSLGMKQRLGFAQAIMENPECLLLDEPFNALDDMHFNVILKSITEMKKDKLIIIAAHGFDAAKHPICDRVISMSDGKIEHIEQFP